MDARVEGVKEHAGVVVRPSIPPLVWFSAAVWYGVVFAEELSWCAGRLTPRLLALGVVVCVIVGLSTLARLRAVAALVFIGLLGGGVVAALAWHSAGVASEVLTKHGGAMLRVEVLADSVVGQFGASSRARVVAPAASAGAALSVQWPSGGEVPEAGALVECVGRLAVSALPDRRRAELQDGLVGSLRARVVKPIGKAQTLRGLFLPVRRWASEQVDRVAGPGGDLLAGILIGDRRRLSGTSADTAFRTSGLTHLVAVSGSHLVVVAALASAFCVAMALRRGWRSLLVLGVVGSYVVFSGLQTSAVRALVMSAVTFGRPYSSRRGDSGAALGLTVAVMLLLDPRAAFDLGFQLSVGAVVGLVFFGRLFEHWCRAALPHALRLAAAPLALTLAAQATTLPLIARTFGVVSLVSPVANIVVGPLISVALVVGVVGLGATPLWPWLGASVLKVAGAMCALSAGIAGRLASLPAAAVLADRWVFALTVLSAALMPVIWVVWPQGDGRLARRLAMSGLITLVIVALGPVPSAGPTMTVLDVGQGDAILLRDGRAGILVDTGPGASALRAALARCGLRRLDAVVLTHDHADHTGGLDGLEGAVPYGGLLLSGASASTTDAQAPPGADTDGSVGIRRLAQGDALAVGRWRLAVLWPSEGVAVEETNDTSVVIMAECGEFKALLTGDAESGVLEQLRGAGRLGDVDVLKVAHHGSTGAVSAEQLDVLRPEIALISVGVGNKFGHPARETISLLGTHGCRIVRTDESGDITLEVSSSGQRYGLRTARAAGGSACETIPALVGTPIRLGCGKLDGAERQRSQERLSHLWCSAVAARAGPRAPEGPLLGVRRSRLQSADLPRGKFTGRRRRGGVQHCALHVRAPPRHRARCRQDAEGRPRHTRRLRA